VSKRVITAVAAAVVAATALLASASIASAYAPSDRDVRDALNVAENYWSNRGYVSSCNSYYWRSRPLYGGALAQTRGCVITFNSRTRWNWLPQSGKNASWWRVCETTVHEFGHLRGIGKAHNSNPDSIMASSEQLNWDAWWWPYFPACKHIP
jgi:predicted Zn-dependent protease